MHDDSSTYGASVWVSMIAERPHTHARHARAYTWGAESASSALARRRCSEAHSSTHTVRACRVRRVRVVWVGYGWIEGDRVGDGGSMKGWVARVASEKKVKGKTTKNGQGREIEMKEKFESRSDKCTESNEQRIKRNTSIRRNTYQVSRHPKCNTPTSQLHSHPVLPHINTRCAAHLFHQRRPLRRRLRGRLRLQQLFAQLVTHALGGLETLSAFQL